MKKLLIIISHLFYSSFGVAEYYLSKGFRKYNYNLGYHYSSRLPYDHPAYQDISIVLIKNPQEPFCTSYMLCNDALTSTPLFCTRTILLN